MFTNLPAHQTKHLPTLNCRYGHHEFVLTQLNDGHSNGSCLWLGAQCLAAYMADKNVPTLPKNRRPRVIELGSGIGFTALALASLGYDVLATDMAGMISSVLQRNIENNQSDLPISAGSIEVRELDWTVRPNDWTWNHVRSIASKVSEDPASLSKNYLLHPPFDLIISSDTLYSRELAHPFLRTAHALCMASSPAPPVLLCIERRDSDLIDLTLQDAKTIFKFHVARIAPAKLAKSMKKGGLKWEKDDWDGIELWKLTVSKEQQ